MVQKLRYIHFWNLEVQIAYELGFIKANTLNKAKKYEGSNLSGLIGYLQRDEERWSKIKERCEEVYNEVGEELCGVIADKIKYGFIFSDDQKDIVLKVYGDKLDQLKLKFCYGVYQVKH